MRRLIREYIQYYLQRADMDVPLGRIKCSGFDFGFECQNVEMNE